MTDFPTGVPSPTQQIGVFVAEWLTCNDGENLEGETEAWAARLREALRAAFPKASKADVSAAFEALKRVMSPLPTLRETQP